MQNRVDQLEAGEKDPGRTFPEIDARYVYMTTLPYMHSWAYLNPLPDGQLVPPLPPGRNISIAPWTDLSKIQASGMWQLFLMRSSLAFVAGTVSPSDMVRFGEGTPRAWRRINACTRYLVGMYKRTPEFYVRNPHVQFMEAEFEEYFATMLQQLNAPQPPDQQPEDQEMPEEAPPQHDAPIQDHSALFASALESAGAMDKFRIAGCNRRDLKVKALDWEGGGRLGAADIAEPIATPEVLGKRPRTTGPFGSGSCRYRFATSANFIYDPRTCA
ncbi:hypothetical protein FRB90_004264 [Tulasnella sp. 427]|nr:hypothetical protein FRB90_004264 [Tulasnella sp. 427]